MADFSQDEVPPPWKKARKASGQKAFSERGEEAVGCYIWGKHLSTMIDVMVLGNSLKETGLKASRLLCINEDTAELSIAMLMKAFWNFVPVTHLELPEHLHATAQRRLPKSKLAVGLDARWRAQVLAVERIPATRFGRPSACMVHDASCSPRKRCTLHTTGLCLVTLAQEEAPGRHVSLLCKVFLMRVLCVPCQSLPVDMRQAHPSTTVSLTASCRRALDEHAVAGP